MMIPNNLRDKFTPEEQEKLKGVHISNLHKVQPEKREAVIRFVLSVIEKYEQEEEQKKVLERDKEKP